MLTLLGHVLQVLKRRRKDGSSLIKVDQLRDGVVLFEDAADAERYSNYLEADNSSQVSLCGLILTEPRLWLMPRPSTPFVVSCVGLPSELHIPCCR